MTPHVCLWNGSKAKPILNEVCRKATLLQFLVYWSGRILSRQSLLSAVATRIPFDGLFFEPLPCFVITISNHVTLAVLSFPVTSFSGTIDVNRPVTTSGGVLCPVSTILQSSCLWACCSRFLVAKSRLTRPQTPIRRRVILQKILRAHLVVQALPADPLHEKRPPSPWWSQPIQRLRSSWTKRSVLRPRLLARIFPPR